MTKAYQLQHGRCKRKVLFEQALKEFPTDPKQYRYEPKADGHRYWFQLRPNGAKFNYLTTRTVSKVTGSLMERQDDYPIFRDLKIDDSIANSVLDGEMVSSSSASTSSEVAHSRVEGTGHLIVWDIVMYKGQSVQKLPLTQRLVLLRRVVDRLLELNSTIVASKSSGAKCSLSMTPHSSDPKQLLDEVLAAGGEGIVKKRLDSTYGEDWVAAIGVHTYDCVVWGTTVSESKSWRDQGLIGALKIGQWMLVNSSAYSGFVVKWTPACRPVPGFTVRHNKQFYIFIDCGTCSGFTLPVRRAISERPRAYTGKVVRIKAKSRLSHTSFRMPRFGGFREDKPAIECNPE